MDRFIEGKNINLRNVEVTDAEFILSLRTDPIKSAFLHHTDNDIDKQIDYIKNYKLKDDEYYFIIEDKMSNSIGTIRLYDIQKEIDSFCCGSWLIKDEEDVTTAIESVVMIYDFGFFTLKFNNLHIDVKKNNTKVINFHKLFGVTLTAEDNDSYYYTYSKADYILFKKRLNI